ncbi:uncharacterized protein ATC70_003093 [Mucor velutinosus]|uniref:CCHC-type domain-containing protein n=1 Tax=Mucor velutinosus TaxID=708070 RepID=A0AAN7D8C1_9FUNG|nr:hypothetical protein ATC70_003093 [Mucor velutinosus]
MFCEKISWAVVETLWLPTSTGRKYLIENGITLEDGTYLKEFPSFAEDANIVRNLPGEEYATLNLTLSHDPRNECMDLHEPGFECNGKRHLEPLNRVIIWDSRVKEDEQRQTLLQWDQMPAFCRHCQKPDHCRADCPDYHKWANCYHCNKPGHVSKNCDRNNSESVPAKVRAVEKSPAKPKERKGAKPTPPKRADSERRSKPVEDKDHIMPNAPQPNAGSPTHEASQQQIKMTGDTIMEENNTNTKLSDADALNSVSKDVRRSYPEFDPSKAAKKLTRQEGSLDIGDARYQHAETSNPHSNARRMSGDDTDTIDRNLTPPAPSGTPPSTNL